VYANGRLTSARDSVPPVATSCSTTVSVSVFVSERFPSLASTVKVNAPTWVGVPESSPVVESPTPGGGVPLARLHVYEPAPVAVSCTEYGWLSSVGLSDSVVTVTFGTIVIVSSRSAGWLGQMSVAFSQKLQEPACVGVP
jgi:hypothetical protein